MANVVSAPHPSVKGVFRNKPAIPDSSRVEPMATGNHLPLLFSDEAALPAGADGVASVVVANTVAVAVVVVVGTVLMYSFCAVGGLGTCSRKCSTTSGRTSSSSSTSSPSSSPSPLQVQPIFSYHAHCYHALSYHIHCYHALVTVPIRYHARSCHALVTVPAITMPLISAMGVSQRFVHVQSITVGIPAARATLAAMPLVTEPWLPSTRTERRGIKSTTTSFRHIALMATNS